MLRRIPKADLPDAAAPTVRSLLVPEATRIAHDLEQARADAGSLRALRREFGERLERSLPDFASRLELPLDALRAWLTREFAHFVRAHTVRIHLHPSDAERLEETDTFPVLGETSTTIEFVRDASITPGGCVLASERGTLDARVETKLALVIAFLCGGEEVSTPPTGASTLATSEVP
jgi:hypothetical protein